MRKWKCISVNNGNKGSFTVGKTYETDDNMLNYEVDSGYILTNVRIIENGDVESGLVFEEVFDEKEEIKMNKFKVGDRVRIIGNKKSGHRFNVGEIVTITEICNKGREDEHCRAIGKSGRQWYVNYVDIRLESKSSTKTLTITTSDTTTTLTDGTHTTSINRYYTDKHNDMVALEEVVKKYKSEMEEINRPTKGKDLIGVYIPEGTKFRVINVEPHRRNNYVCLDEYIGKVATFNSRGFTFENNWFHCSAIFEEDYMNAIDEKNGRLSWRYDEVEILWED